MNKLIVIKDFKKWESCVLVAKLILLKSFIKIKERLNQIQLNKIIIHEIIAKYFGFCFSLLHQVAYTGKGFDIQQNG